MGYWIVRFVASCYCIYYRSIWLCFSGIMIGLIRLYYTVVLLIALSGVWYLCALICTDTYYYICSRFSFFITAFCFVYIYISYCMFISAMYEVWYLCALIFTETHYRTSSRFYYYFFNHSVFCFVYIICDTPHGKKGAPEHVGNGRLGPFASRGESYAERYRGRGHCRLVGR